jgi:hypothetical protein
MNVKKILENRMHGWLPKEQTLYGVSPNKKSKLTRKGSPTLKERLVGGLGGGGGTLVASAIIFYFFVPMYPEQVIPIMLIVGIPLLAAALLVRKTYNSKVKTMGPRS